MDQISPKERDFCVDLEIGGGISNEVGSINHVSDSSEVSHNVRLLIETKPEGDKAANATVNENNRKKTSAKKPPRPPRSPSLDSADLKLIKEISELAMIKRVRIERMKALKKMKAAKASSSSNGNSFALLITIFFFLVILFQGLSSWRSSPNSLQGSSEITPASEGGFISPNSRWKPSASDITITDSYLSQFSGVLVQIQKTR